MIEFSEEVQSVSSSETSNLTSKHWIGVSNLNENGWQNIDDGSNTVFFDWAPGEPANSTGSNRCVSVDLKGFWYNDDCFNVYPYICEILEASVSSTSQSMTTPESSPFTCHAYFPLAVDMSSKGLTTAEFSALKTFITTSLVKELFPIGLQPSPVARYFYEGGSACQTPNDISDFIRIVNGIKQYKGVSDIYS